MVVRNQNVNTLKGISYKKIEEYEEIYKVLKKADDYVEKVDGVEPCIYLAKSVLSERPENTEDRQKIIIGIIYNHDLIGFSDIILDFPNKETVHIGLVLLITCKRGMGIGSKFMQELESAISKLKYDKIRLAVVQTNDQVSDFWCKIGFKSTKEKRKFEGENIVSTSEIYEKKPLTTCISNSGLYDIIKNNE